MQEMDYRRFSVLASIIFVCTDTVMTHDVQSRTQWHAVLTSSGAEIQVTPEVFHAGLLATLASGFKAKEERGFTYDASFSELHFSHTMNIPPGSKGVNVSVCVHSLRFRLELLVDDATGEMTFRDFKILQLGYITVKTEGLRHLDPIVGFTLTAFAVLALESIKAIGELVGRLKLRQSF
ncbi:uncharacterized protein LOC142802787 [Rhipicephalus microplus]|uniref:uncharacterized protein LOC142802787 n=1 Tax=Rhipicephalus microplus TaxID=6941 RepID=UPI003F6D12D2